MGCQCRRQLCFLCRVLRSLELLTSLSLSSSFSVSLSFPGIEEGTRDQWETLRNCTWRPRLAHLDDKNSVILNRLKITQTWSVHFKIVSKILGYRWKKTNSNWIMIRPKPFVSHHHPLSTRPCHTHRQSFSAIPMLSFLEPSATLAPSLTAIF